MTSGSAVVSVALISASLDRAQDLHARAVLQLVRAPLAARDDLGVDRDGDAAAGARAGRASRRAVSTVAPADSSVSAPLSRTLMRRTPVRANRSGSAAAAQSGSGSPASAPATSSAVTGVSRMPLRWWPGRPHEPVERAAADRRQVVGRRRTQPRLQLLDLQLEHAGHDLAHVAEQLVDAAGGRRGVPAALLHRRAEDVAAVAARDEVRLLAADHPRDEAGLPARVAQPEHLALDRADRHARRVGQPAEPGHVDAGGDDDRAGGDRRAVVEDDAR